ncbi:MAG: TIGR01777 family oxidoreductase [Bacteroidota bacterium]|jgi:uncharacterized protein (TIGR01777 family)|nr:TIGR01777 family oxidoreductase [Sphingobacteriales bacterium]
MSKIMITGGTGLVGKHIANELVKSGNEVVLLGRKSGKFNGLTCYKWDLARQEIDTTALQGVQAIIHLAGAGVADKAWSKAYKQEIYDSRILSTRLLVNTLKHTPNQVQTFISASAIGIYGNNCPYPTGENAPASDTFLAKVCKDWESEALHAESIGLRTTIIRIGVVLAKEGGFIPQVAKPIKFYAGAALGSGNQYISWIHIHDLAGMFIKAVFDEQMRGIYNGVAPHPESNKTITNAMAKRLHRPILLPPVPTFAMKIIFGEMASMLIANQYIDSKKIEQTGFNFQYPSLDNALDELMGK